MCTRPRIRRSCRRSTVIASRRWCEKSGSDKRCGRIIETCIAEAATSECRIPVQKLGWIDQIRSVEIIDDGTAPGEDIKIWVEPNISARRHAFVGEDGNIVRRKICKVKRIGRIRENAGNLAAV